MAIIACNENATISFVIRIKKEIISNSIIDQKYFLLISLYFSDIVLVLMSRRGAVLSGLTSSEMLYNSIAMATDICRISIPRESSMN